MLVRPAEHAGGRSGIEVFMLRRSEASHFVPDAYVFPGGTLDAGDISVEAFDRAVGIDAVSLRAQFRAQRSPSLEIPVDAPTQREHAGLLLAAVRELFEEAGVLLACDRDGRPLSNADLEPERDRLHDAREEVRSGRLRFDQLLSDLDVYANASALTLFSQWITPPAYSRRYDAHFFVAQATSDQAASADRFETHDEIWISPAAALEQCAQGRLRMVYPTIKHIERLARFDGVPEVLEFARTKPIYSVMPNVERRPGSEHPFALPPELEYAW